MFANEPQHPFRIYQLPAWYRTTPDPTTDWLKFCVRGGSAFIGGAEVVVTGTDGELFPCDETFPLAAGAGVNEVTLTAGTAQWWFWIEVSAGAAAINHGSAAPTWDLGHIPVGFVDTATYAAQKICHVRQYQMTDVWPILACPAV